MNKDREVPVRIIIKRKRGGHAAHHGGAWKVAFADFMTAMFSLFLVLWLVNQSTDIRSAVAGYFQDPMGRADEYGSSIMPGEGAQASSVRPLDAPDVLDMRRDRLAKLARKLAQEIKESPQLKGVADKVQIELTEDGLRIQLLEDSTGVFFDTGRSFPNPRGRDLLQLLGRELGQLPNAIRVEGYTDARPYSLQSTYTNWELSTDRANSARRIMSESGLGTDQVKQVRGHAEHELRDPRDPFAASNRRVTITMLLATDSTSAPLDSLPAGPTPVTDALENRRAAAALPPPTLPPMAPATGVPAAPAAATHGGGR
jgi:chemotaxis protein MotB